MRPVAVLFARRDSVYKTIPGCDVYDADRDARTFAGSMPVVAHPPCRAWGQLQHFAKPTEFERALGPWAVDQVRTWGGVLEHPAFSELWLYCALPAPGAVDVFGGWTLPIWQSWFGHRADKPTWLYIVGSPRAGMPRLPMRLGRGEYVVSPSNGKRRGMPGWRPHLRTPERERTPPALAQWLVEMARGTSVEQPAHAGAEHARAA